MGVSHTPFMAGNLLLFDIISYCLAANYTIFAAVRAYAIRPYRYSIKFKRISPIQKIKSHSLIRMLWSNRCRGVSHTPSMAGNLLLFDEISYLSAAINLSFAAVRAYAIRPYRYSVEIKRIYTQQNIKSHSLIRMLWSNRCRGVSHTPFTAGNLLLFDIISYYLAGIYAFFAAVRAYAIRHYRYSVKIKWLYPKQNIKSHSLIRMLWSNRCRGVSHTPFMAGNLLLFDEISYISAAIYTLFAAMRAYAIRPYNYSVEIKRI